MSLYLDHQLKSGLKGRLDEEVNGVLEDVMTIFRYLEEKDMFEKYYRQHLTKRLLGGRSM